MAYQDIYDQEMRRRKIQEAILQQSLEPGGVYNVSGRTVPYSPVEGLSRLGQAMIARTAMERGDERLEAAREAEEAKRRRLAEEITQQYTGTPEVAMDRLGPPSLPEERNVISPAVESDPRGAIIKALSAPETEKMGLTLAKMQGTDRGGYFTPRETVLSDGTVVYEIFDHRTGQWQETGRKRSPKDPAAQQDLAAAKAKGKIKGTSQAEAEIDVPRVEETSAETDRLVDELTAHPGLKDVIGFPDNPLVAKGLVPGTQAADFRVKLKQLTGRTFMEIFPTLKGGGQITEVEGQKGQESINRMSTATTEKEFVSAANDFKKEVKRLKDLVRQRAGLPVSRETPKVLRFDAQGNPL